jgi:hypothetical protein
VAASVINAIIRDREEQDQKAAIRGRTLQKRRAVRPSMGRVD